jgi:hypothetical protein
VSPVVVHNLLILASFVAAGVAMYALVRELTGSIGAAWFSAAGFAFQPYRFGHYSQLELLWTWPIPLAFLALDRLIATGRVRSGAWLGVAVAVQAWSCVYYSIFLATALAVVTPFFVWKATRPDRLRMITGLAVAAAIGLVLIAPYAIAYVGAARSLGLRPVQDVSQWSATLADYATTPLQNSLYGSVLGRGYAVEHALFPGVVVVAAALFGVFDRFERRRLAYAILAIVALDWSLGLNGASYGALYKWVWVYRGLRVPARMFVIVSVALCVLAGYGVADLLHRVENRPWRRVAAAGLTFACLVEFQTTPSLTRVPEIPLATCRFLAAQPQSVVAEWPMPRASALGLTHEPVYMYYSTRHWQRLVNGYSGFYPESYIRMLDATASFPSPEAVAYLRRLSVAYIVLHSEYDPPRYVDVRRALENRADVELLSTERQDSHEVALYVIRSGQGSARDQLK